MGSCESKEEHESVLTSDKTNPLVDDSSSILRHRGDNFEGTNYHFVRATQESNKTVVCVHGIGSFNSDFEHLSSHLVDRGFDVLRYDLIGRGFSEYPDDGSFDAAAHVEQLRHLIVHLKINNPDAKYHVVGFSMGGALATIYTAEFAHEIESLTVLAPAGLMDLGPLPVIRACKSTVGTFLKYAHLKPNQRNAWRQGYSHPDTNENALRCVREYSELNALRPRHFDAMYESMMQFPLTGLDDTVTRLRTSTDVSVHVVWGEGDDMVPFVPNYSRWCTLLSVAPSQQGEGIKGGGGGGRGRVATNSVQSERKMVQSSSVQGLKHAFFLEEPDTCLPIIGNFIAAVDAFKNNKQIQSHAN